MKKFLLFIAFVAICNCQGIFAQNPYGTYELNKAEELAKKGNYKEAELYYKKNITNRPTDWTGYFSISMFYSFATHDFDKGLKNMNIAIKYAPQVNEILGGLHGLKGEIEEQTSDSLKAIDDYNLSIKYSGDTLGYLGRGDLYYRKKKYDKSNADYSQVLKVNPNSSIALTGMGRNAAAIKDYNRALTYYNKAARLDPEYLYSREMRATCLYNMGRYKEGIKDVIYIYKKDDYHNYIVEFSNYWMLPEFETALEEQKRLNPKDPQWRTLIGDVKTTKEIAKMAKEQHWGETGK
jgi:tetratricopeptide (TPR) repeat protein